MSAPKTTFKPTRTAAPTKEKEKPLSAKKLTSLEKRIHELGLSLDEQLLTQDVLLSGLNETVITTDINDALNALTRKRLLKFLHVNGEPLWKAIDAKQVESQGTLSDDSVLVLDVIKQAGDKAIWVGTIKKKLGLGPAVDKCIKNLEAQKLIKPITAIGNKTKRMYILEGLTPNTELTGGPWYANSELDTHLIGALQDFISKYIAEQSRPTMLSPFSHNPHLPTADDIHKALQKSEVTNLDLELKNIEELLEVLRLDGSIERIMIERAVYNLDYDEHAHRRKRVKRDGSDAIDDDDDTAFEGASRPGPSGNSKHYYVYKAKPAEAVDLGIVNGLTDCPCGICPLATSCDNRGHPSVPDRALSDSVAIVNLKPSKESARERDKRLLVLKPPGTIAEDEKGVWRGGGSRGKQKSSSINPQECHYYTKWFEGPTE